MPRKSWDTPMWQSYVSPAPPATPESDDPEERTEEELEELIERSEHGFGGDIRGVCTGAVHDHKPVNYARGPHDNEFGLDDDTEEFEPIDPDEDEFADHRSTKD